MPRALCAALSFARCSGLSFAPLLAAISDWMTCGAGIRLRSSISSPLRGYSPGKISVAAGTRDSGSAHIARTTVEADRPDARAVNLKSPRMLLTQLGRASHNHARKVTSVGSEFQMEFEFRTRT